ncbi:MAG: YbaN family protein [Acidimicrobiia bacterium]
MSRPVASRTLRGIYMTLGVMLLVIGAVGVVLPLVPTTGSIILAAFFFARSSPRFERWLLNHRLFGAIIRKWRSGEGYTAAEKGLAVAAILATFTISIIVVGIGWLRVFLAVLAVAVAGYVASLPTRRI